MTDVLVPTNNNPLWLARCMASLKNYYPGGEVFVESESEARDWLGNIKAGLKKVKTPLVFVIQDDAQLMCLRPSWLDELTKPFADDPLVAISCMTATQVGYPHQSVRLALPPGPYYTSMFIPIAFAARPDALAYAIEGIDHDMYCDHEPSLRLLMAGYKLVMNTHLPVYHEGMQSNPRIYGGSDPKAWMDAAREDTIRTIRKKYPPIWIQRMEQLEMVPMQTYVTKTTEGMVTRL